MSSKPASSVACCRVGTTCLPPSLRRLHTQMHFKRDRLTATTGLSHTSLRAEAQATSAPAPLPLRPLHFGEPPHRQEEVRDRQREREGSWLLHYFYVILLKPGNKTLLSPIILCVIITHRRSLSRQPWFHLKFIIIRRVKRKDNCLY